MSRNILKSTISPTIKLTTITIYLRDDAAVPTVQMEGQVLLSNPRARAVTQALIRTAHLTSAGVTFIEEMKSMFGAAASKDAKVP